MRVRVKVRESREGCVRTHGESNGSCAEKKEMDLFSYRNEYQGERVEGCSIRCCIP